MRIGVDVCPISENKTGVGNYILYILEELLALRPDDHFFLYTFRDLSNILHFSRYSNVTLRQGRSFSFSEILWSQTTLPWMCRKDKLECFWGPTQSIPFILPRSTATVITIYDFAYLLYPQTVPYIRGCYLRLFSKIFYKKASRLTTISHGTAQRLNGLYNLSTHAVIPCPIKPSLQIYGKEKLTFWLQAQGLQYNGYLMTLGTLEPRKNLEGVISSYLQAIEKYGEKKVMPLVIVGGKGWRSHSLKALLTTIFQKFPENVRLLGYKSDEEVNKYLEGARYFLMLSHYEGYGMPLAEARVCGTSVICLSVPEMIEAAENDAIILPRENYQETLSTLFYMPETLGDKVKRPVNYRSNRESAHRLSQQIDELFKESQVRYDLP